MLVYQRVHLISHRIKIWNGICIIYIYICLYPALIIDPMGPWKILFEDKVVRRFIIYLDASNAGLGFVCNWRNRRSLWNVGVIHSKFLSMQANIQDLPETNVGHSNFCWFLIMCIFLGMIWNIVKHVHIYIFIMSIATLLPTCRLPSIQPEALQQYIAAAYPTLDATQQVSPLVRCTWENPDLEWCWW